MIHAKVPVKKGKVVSDGDYVIDGVPGTGARVELSFFDPGGATTGRLLPTGNVVDEIILDSGEKVSLTIVDAGNPTAFFHAKDLGLKGTELPSEFDQDERMRTRLEAIRKRVAELMGIPLNPSIPKVAFVAPPQDYKTVTQKEIRRERLTSLPGPWPWARCTRSFRSREAFRLPLLQSFRVRLSMRSLETGGESLTEEKIEYRPSVRILDVEVEARQDEKEIHVVQCTIGRTARKIMEGRVYISKGI